MLVKICQKVQTRKQSQSGSMNNHNYYKYNHQSHYPSASVQQIKIRLDHTHIYFILNWNTQVSSLISPMKLLILHWTKAYTMINVKEKRIKITIGPVQRDEFMVNSLKQESQTRTGFRLLPTAVDLLEHSLQKIWPQLRQWCFLIVKLKPF